MPVLKLHSEKSVAAYVANGWILSRAFYNGDEREGYEFLMRRDDPALLRASSEQISRTRRLFIVEDVFTIKERGVVALPGIPIDSDISIVDGDFAVVIARQKAAMFQISQMVCLNLKSPYHPILLQGASKSDIEIGSSIWIVHKPNQGEQAAPSNR
jgi:hypothetical protein